MFRTFKQHFGFILTLVVIALFWIAPSLAPAKAEKMGDSEAGAIASIDAVTAARNSRIS